MSFRLTFFLCALLLSVVNLTAQNYCSLPIVPKPLQSTQLNETLFFGNEWSIYIDPQSKIDATYISSVLKEHGISSRFTDKKSDAMFIMIIDKKISKNPEAYLLTISEKSKITASATTNKGLLYALHTLRQIISNQDDRIAITACKIKDEPAYPWRAFLLDESRHFQGMEIVKKLLDEMAYLKMNIFHWHLVDDPGWRIEIKKYPELTSVGSLRNFSNPDLTPEQWNVKFPGKKTYYTQDEIREIVDYAEKRGIQIMPEIEVPGHASAAIAAYPWLGSSSKQQDKGIWGDLYNVTDPIVEKFIQDVLDEVIALFPSKIIHIGGDEANYTHWQNNAEIIQFMKEKNIPTFADLQVWSINRFSKYLESKSVRMMGWNEITGDNIRGEAHIEAGQTEKLAEGTIVHFWDGDISLVNKAIDKGYDVVNSNRHFTYVDYPYEVTPLEKAYSFSPVPEGLSKDKQSKILGLGSQMWGEFTPTPTRIYYQTFPRIAALAENGWIKPDNKNYKEFCYRMKNTERRWRKMGYFNQQPSYSKQDDTFTLWQLPSQINTIGNSYVIQTADGKVIVIDGGVKDEENYLRGFLSALGNRVHCWFVTHPHGDHMGALTQILENRKGLDIDQICHSTFSDNLLNGELGSKAEAIKYYETAEKSGIKIIEASPGMTFEFGSTTFKVLGIKNEEIMANTYNNSSMVIKVWDPVKSVLFLADLGAEAGDKLLNGPYGNELDCDYMQMSHHGQNGVTMDFYSTVKFRACLWPTPSWVYNNDVGKGFNTHILTTIETRETVESLNITEQYISYQGLIKIE